jgi:hypothetical protein
MRVEQFKIAMATLPKLSSEPAELHDEAKDVFQDKRSVRNACLRQHRDSCQIDAFPLRLFCGVILRILGAGAGGENSRGES